MEISNFQVFLLLLLGWIAFFALGWQCRELLKPKPKRYYLRKKKPKVVSYKDLLFGKKQQSTKIISCGGRNVYGNHN